MEWMVSQDYSGTDNGINGKSTFINHFMNYDPVFFDIS
jgi:hypothetical protein